MQTHIFELRKKMGNIQWPAKEMFFPISVQYTNLIEH